ncbi:hypothetical protein CI102_11230 [Trichoderma harzianum]|nr:hypothetical protein CI102_11230 [Trichoderma harzianum]
MTQSETPPPQRQSHPTSSNLRHSGMPWILQPDATKLPAPITRPIALQHSRAAYKAQPLSLSPAPPHPFLLPFVPFFLRLVLFLLKYGGRYLTRARKHEKVGAWHLYLYMYPHREPGGAVTHDNIDVLILVPASMIDSEITDQK